MRYVNSEKVTAENVAEKLGRMSGILVAPGFGNRGIEGKIVAVRYARENKIPFLGICLGMQCAVIEFARNVLGLADANSSEMESTPHPVIDLMEEQKGVTAKGGTMRLGAYPCTLKKGSKVAAAYGKLHISSVTVTVTNSTMITWLRSKVPVCRPWVSIPTRGWSRSSRSRGIPGSSVRSTIPNIRVRC